MKRKGYFQEGIKPLDTEHELRNYDKSLMWLEKGIIPEFLREDIKKYISIKLIGE